MNVDPHATPSSANAPLSPDHPRSQSAPAPAWWAREDWLAVWLGAVVLVLIVAGVRRSLPSLGWRDASGLARVFSPATLVPWAIAGLAAFVLSLPGIAAQGGVSVTRYAAGFPIVFGLAFAAQVLAGSAFATTWGLEYVIFALLLGLLISNTIGTPPWLLEAARTEYFIKTGLVVMGATILLQEILQAGALGILQAIGVVIVVWYVAFWLARRLRLDDELSVMLASAVSICGVSAAIAACGAIQGDRRKLSYVTSLVLIVAVPMIVLQPWLARVLELPDAVAGAWLGGTLDTTGSVVAAGALISERAMKIGTIVKFSQNVLIGAAAFLLSLWWSLRTREGAAQERPGIGVIWERFPKFVLGFLAASVVFSFLLDPAFVASVKAPIGAVRTLWFALAFVSIGLETRVVDLIGLEGGRPLIGFVSAQAFNVVWTLLLAWLIFGGAMGQAL